MVHDWRDHPGIGRQGERELPWRTYRCGSAASADRVVGVLAERA